MSEKEEVKIGLGTFTIVVIAFVLVVVTICGAIYLSHISDVNNKPKKHNSIGTKIVGTDNTVTNTVKDVIKINTKNTYAFTCKTVVGKSQYDMENTLVEISKTDGKETEIMKFSSGAYDYADGKLYFYENTANSYHRFYMIDLENSTEPSEIYSFEYRYGSTDNLEYYNNKLYYTFNGELVSLNLVDKQITTIAPVKNIIFKIDNEKDILYYVNSDNSLVAMNLKTSEETVIDSNSGVIDIFGDKLLYAKLENNETWYWNYDLQSKQKTRIAESWGGTIGKNEIFRYNNGYLYLNGEGQLMLLGDDESIQVLTDEGNFNALTLLTNKVVLLERNEGTETEDYKTYTFNLESKQLTQTSNNYRYSNTKYIE